MTPGIHSTKSPKKARKTKLLVDFVCTGELFTNLVEFASSVVISLVIVVSVGGELYKIKPEEISVI